MLWKLLSLNFFFDFFLLIVKTKSHTISYTDKSVPCAELPCAPMNRHFALQGA